VFTELFPGNALFKSVTIFLINWIAPFYKATKYLYIVAGNPFGKQPPERQIKCSENNKNLKLLNLWFEDNSSTGIAQERGALIWQLH
jgi:hypothetical protein